jgi:hypothetical protein
MCYLVVERDSALQVIYDTLIEQSSPEEVEAVIGRSFAAALAGTTILIPCTCSSRTWTLEIRYVPGSSLLPFVNHFA